MMRVQTVVAAVMAVLLAGCGVPVQKSPVDVRPEAMPSQLRPGATTQPEPPSTADPTRSVVLVHFSRDDRLVGLPREAPVKSPRERLDAVLAALLAGPTDREQAGGITSALPQGLQINVLSLDGPVVVLELSGETDGRSATENVLAVGQIVLSVTSSGAAREVRLARDGAPVEALLADGALTADPLTAADYAVLKAA